MYPSSSFSLDPSSALCVVRCLLCAALPVEVLTARATCSWPTNVLGALFPIDERAGGMFESEVDVSVAGTIEPATAGHPRTSRDHIV